MPPLVQSNPYLADSTKRRAMLMRSVIESSAFEGIERKSLMLGQRRRAKARPIASATKRVRGK